jgi:glyoxylase-like metal-dependent hydrolase (beta-lactamase superfamily II)
MPGGRPRQRPLLHGATGGRDDIFATSFAFPTTLLFLLHRRRGVWREQWLVDTASGLRGGSSTHHPIVTHRLRDNTSVFEGSGGNIAVLTGGDGKVLIDAGIGVTRPQITKALAELGAEPVTHLVNTHWHFDHADGNGWLHTAGAKIIAQENTRKHLSEIQRVEDWDYNFLPLPSGAIPSEVFAGEYSLKLNGSSIGLKYYGPAHTGSDISVTFRGQHRSCWRYLLERYLSVH